MKKFILTSIVLFSGLALAKPTKFKMQANQIQCSCEDASKDELGYVGSIIFVNKLRNQTDNQLYRRGYELCGIEHSKGTVNAGVEECRDGNGRILQPRGV